MAPRVGVRGDARPTRSDFAVDRAFGPGDDNDAVYSRAAVPLVDLGLRGGVCTLLAYGQTGSGKTHTIQGVLGRLAEDVFSRQERLEEGAGRGRISLHVSFYELLGDEVTDLLGGAGDGGGRRVEVMEDAFGAINTRGVTELAVESPEQFRELCDSALSHRRTQATFRNDSSSRSHAVCAVRVSNGLLREAEDGRLFVVDLAGSESAADSQFHDRELVRETKLINRSLSSLKDCIRNRALSALNPGRFYHVPYRLSKLTLLLKDAFEVESHRHCKTVVVACVSPSVADVAMTLGTLRYAVPIKVGQMNRDRLPPNPKNPATWSNAELRRWVDKTSRGAVSADTLCPHESGMQLLRVPETEFIRRVLEGSGKAFGEKRAKAFYTSLWKLLIDARTAERKAKLKPKVPNRYKDVEKLAAEWLEELDKNQGEAINVLREQEWEQRTKQRVEEMEQKQKRLQANKENEHE